jgi:hypothetical protein
MTAQSKAPFYVFVLLLIAAGIATAVWRHLELGVPWKTGEQQPVWMIEARVDFEGLGEAAKVNLHIPENPPGFRILTEQAASPGYGFAILEESGSRRPELRPFISRLSSYRKTHSQNLSIPHNLTPGTNSGKSLSLPPCASYSIKPENARAAPKASPGN